MSYTLVVVDMQVNFKAYRGVISACERAVNKAMKNKAAIVFLEYKDHGPTHTRLSKLVKNYERKIFMTKPRNDGSKQVNNACINFKFPKNHYKVCGVNTNYCVRETVCGLHQLFKMNAGFKLEVLGDSVNCNDRGTHAYGLTRMSCLSKVKVTKLPKKAKRFLANLPKKAAYLKRQRND